MLGQGAERQYIFGAVMGQGDDHAVGGQFTAGGLDDEPAGAGPAVGAFDRRPHGRDGVGQVDGDTGLAQSGRPLVTVKGTQGHSAPADVAGAAIGQQARLEDLGGHGQRSVSSRQVDGGEADKVPQRRDGGLALPVGRQPVLEGLVVQGGLVEVEPGQGQGGGAEAGAVGGRDEAEA